jgi:hypothetical protein
MLRMVFFASVDLIASGQKGADMSRKSKVDPAVNPAAKIIISFANGRITGVMSSVPGLTAEVFDFDKRVQKLVDGKFAGEAMVSEVSRANAGTETTGLARLMGHTTTRTLERYVSNTFESHRKAVTDLQDRLNFVFEAAKNRRKCATECATENPDTKKTCDAIAASHYIPTS